MIGTNNVTSAICSNICSQLLQREMNRYPLSNPKSFAAHLYRERYRLAKNLYKSDLRAHFGCVNAIEFSHGGKYLASGGDDKRVLIWDIEKTVSRHCPPRVLSTEHTSNIFCLGFDRRNRKVLSGGNDDLVIVHDFETGKLDNVFKHENPVYGLSVDPQCDNIFATACEDGQILVFDQRIDPADPFVVAQLRTSFHAVEFHPTGGNFLVTANSKRGAAFWDIRKPHHPVIQYGYMEDPPSCMSVRFNSNGTLILALRRRLPPILYNTQSPEPVCTFYHGNYYNSCTMKSCTFAGEDDEFVLSGSDDFNLYVWRVSDVDLERTDQWIETTQMVLYGHRSIVNQVRYNRQKCLLASSGVEKIVKLWSPFAQKGWLGSLLDEATCSDNPRELYSPYNFTSMATPPHSWSHMSHDYSSRNTSEDPRMMAFFDSLIQQEIEGWETNSSTDSPIDSVGSRRSHSSSNESSNSSSDNDDDDNDDAGDGAGERVTRRIKRHLVRKKEHKRRNSVLRKLKLPRQKYANRIAYLIATKRNILRRLAIKGASLSNRRPHKIVNVGRRISKTAATSSAVTPSTSKNARGSANSRSVSTSTTPFGFRPHRRKIKNKRIYDSSSDNDTESGNPIAGGGSSRCSGITLPNTAPIPSTSTGITSSFQEDIIRLRQQQQNIIDSDDDDDDDEDDGLLPQRQAIDGIVVDFAMQQPTKKLNGLRRVSDVTVTESNRSELSVVTQTVAAGETNTTGDDSLVIQRNLQNEEHRERIENWRPTTITSNINISSETHSSSSLSSSISNTTTTTTTATMLPQSNTNNIINNNNSTSFFTIQGRDRPHADLVDNYSSHSNSRLSNSTYQDDVYDLSISSSSDTIATSNDVQQQQPQLQRQYHHQDDPTPLKRRRLGMMEYINVRSALQNDESEQNNNEQNNNSIFALSCRHDEDEYVSSNNHNSNNNINNILIPNGNCENIDEGQVTPLKLQANANRNHPYSLNNNNHDSYQPEDLSENVASTSSNSLAILHTPDSGISVATTITPSHTGCSGTSNNDDGDGGDSTASASTHQPPVHKFATNLQVFQQKVAHLRRNYRKKFDADESDSD